jgi:hypothetical protein
MAKNKVSEWNSNPASNTDVGGVDIAEGCAPSGINNAIREVMAQIKDLVTGADNDNFTVGGNLTVDGTSTLTGAVTAPAGLTGNVTGNVTGDLIGNASTATTVPDGAITTAKIADANVTTVKIADANVTDAKLSLTANSVAIKTAINATGSAPIFAARAWVNFNGTGTVAIRDSGNVSSITDNGTGDYTINFTTAMPDDNYAPSITTRFDTSGGNNSFFGSIANITGSIATTSLRVLTQASQVLNTRLDSETVSVAIFR